MRWAVLLNNGPGRATAATVGGSGGTAAAAEAAAQNTKIELCGLRKNKLANIPKLDLR